MKWVWRILGILVAVLVIAFLAFRVPDTDPAEMRAKYAVKKILVFLDYQKAQRKYQYVFKNEFCAEFEDDEDE